MKPAANQYDVFLSYSPADAERVRWIRSSLEGSALRVFDPQDSKLEKNADQAVKLAIAESSALVAIVESHPWISPNILMAIGAAWGWKKPVYVLTTNVEGIQRELSFVGAHVYHMSRIDEVGLAIRDSIRPLSQEDREALASIYKAIGISSDRLVMDPLAVEQLAQAFRRRKQKDIPEERLVREIIQMRKQGKLPRLSRKRAGSPA